MLQLIGLSSDILIFLKNNKLIIIINSQGYVMFYGELNIQNYPIDTPGEKQEKPSS